jgi:1-deoxy-D-xylulose-5-phosphate reductoisomerase
MTKKILIIGSTGKLGKLLVNYCKKNNIQIDAITSYKNFKLQISQQKELNIKHGFCLSKKDEIIKFKNYIKLRKFKVVYFLDYGALSLNYINIIINNNSKTNLCIANKEMIIAGGKLLIDKINSSDNILVPLDSEHFSMVNSNTSNNEIDKVYITASGGPFYFKKKTNLNHVSLKQVLNHPKWDMGKNNSIDSSNFINKVLEIIELSIIFNIDINKIDFLVSKEAFVHSIIIYKNSTLLINCFENNMLIPMISPLLKIFNSKQISFNKSKTFDLKNFQLETINDNRFKILKYMDDIKSFNHLERIHFLLLNNKAHSMYLKNKLKYNRIINFIFKNIPKKNLSYPPLNSFSNIIKLINGLKSKYEI